MKEIDASSYARPSLPAATGAAESNPFLSTTALQRPSSLQGTGTLRGSGTSVVTPKGVAASTGGVLVLEEGLGTLKGPSGTVLMSRPELPLPAATMVDEPSYSAAHQGLESLAKGNEDMPPLDVVLNQALVSMLKSGLNQKKGLFEETQSQRIALAATYALKEEAIKSQAIFQFNQGINKGSMGVISGSNAVVTEILMAVLTIVTAGAAAPATTAATTAGKAMAEIGTQMASKTAAELAKGGVKAGVQEAVKDGLEEGVKSGASSLAQHSLSEAEKTAIAKSVMSSTQQIAFQGSKSALTQTLIAHYSAPIKETLKNLIKEKLPQVLKERVANDAETALAKKEAKAQAKLETQAKRAAEGPRSTGQKLKDAVGDKAKSITASIKDWGRIDTNEMIDGIVDYGVNYAIRQAVDELTESRDPSRNIQTMYGNWAEVEKKVATVLGRTADAANDAIQMTQEGIDQIRQSITDSQQTFQQLMAAQAQSEKRINQAI